MRLAGSVGALLVALCASQLARADEPTQAADALIAEGIHLREQGKDEDALDRFRKADALESTPRSRGQIALAEQALGLWVAAEEDLGAALAKPEDPWIVRNRTALDGALDTIRKHLATLEVRSGAPGAEVLLDGKRIGPLPLTARVEAGSRTLLVRAPGYYPTSRVVQISPGSSARETIELVAAPAENSEPPRADGAAKAPNERSASVQRTVGWTSLGVGGGLLAMGAIGFAIRQSAVSGYNDDKTCPGIGKPAQPPACQDRISRADTWQTLGIIGLAGGGALVLTGVVLLVTAPSAASAHVATNGVARVAQTAACGPSSDGVSCGARWSF
jgi:hypothetical protein